MIPPGGEGKIKVTLRPKGQHTEIVKNIIVVSNDPEQPRFTLTMKGTLLVDMIAKPATLVIRDLSRGKPGSERVSLERSEGSTADIESVRVEDERRFSVQEVPAESGALATYEIRFEGSDELGISSTRVVVQTTGEHTSELVIPVRATVSTNLRYPKRFGFSWRDGKVVERTIRISTRRGDAPKIEKVEDPDGLLDIEVLAAEGPTTGIRMTVRESELAGADPAVMHTLIVHTNDPDEPRAEIQYRVTPQPKAKQMKLSAQ